jgi:hypothetical protein
VALALIAIVAAGCGLRCVNITGRGLSYFEACSWRFAHDLPFGNSLVAVANSGFSPAYYVLLRIWVWVFGDSELALRSISVLLSALATMLVFEFARRLANFKSSPSEPERPARSNGVGLGAALLFASAAESVWLGGQARLYSLELVLVFATSCLLVGNLGTTSPVGWSAYACFAVLAILCHSQAVWVVIAHGLIAVQWYRGSRDSNFGKSKRVATIAFATIAAVAAPWIATLLAHQPLSRTSGHIALDLSEAMTAWTYTLWPAQEISGSSSWHAPCVGLLTILFLGKLFLSSLVAQRSLFLLTAVYFSGLLATLWLAGSHVWQPDLVVPATFAYLALALVVFSSRSGIEKWLLVMGIVAFNGYQLYLMSRQQYIARNEGIQAVVRYLLDNRLAGEPIVVLNPEIYPSVLYYLRSSELGRQNDTSAQIWLSDAHDSPLDKPLYSDRVVCSSDQTRKWYDRRVWLIESSRINRPLPRPELPYPWRTALEPKTFADGNIRNGKIAVGVCEVIKGMND